MSYGSQKKDVRSCTFEHILPLAIQDTGPGLEIARSQEISNGNSFWVWRLACIHGHLILLLLWLWLLLLLLLSLRLLLGLRLSLLVLLDGLHPQLVDILLRGQTQLCCLCGQRLALLFGELFGRHPSFCGLRGELLLHGSNLLRGGLAWSGHLVRREENDGQRRRPKEEKGVTRSKGVLLSALARWSQLKWPDGSTLGTEVETADWS